MPVNIPHVDLVREIEVLRNEIELLKATPKYRGVTFPAVPLGAVRDFGFTSLDATSFVDLFRADVLLTAPILDYDVQVTNLYESTAVTSIEWQITASHYFDPAVPVTTAVVASGSATAAELTAGSGFKQFFGTVDITDPANLGPVALFRFVRFDFEAKRTGGSGDGAALRLVRPPILKVPS